MSIKLWKDCSFFDYQVGHWGYILKHTEERKMKSKVVLGEPSQVHQWYWKLAPGSHGLFRAESAAVAWMWNTAHTLVFGHLFSVLRALLWKLVESLESVVFLKNIGLRGWVMVLLPSSTSYLFCFLLYWAVGTGATCSFHGATCHHPLTTMMDHFPWDRKPN